MVNVIHKTASESDGKARRRAENTRRFVEAGLAILAAEGLDGLTMQRLAGELDYAVGAAYRYFKGKDELLVAMERHVFEAIRRDLLVARKATMAHTERARSLDEIDVALLTLLGAIRTYRSVAERRPSQFSLIALSLGDPRQLVDAEMAQAILPPLTALFAEVAELFDCAAQVGALEPGSGPRRALTLWAGLHGTLATAKLARFGVPSLDAELLADELTRTLLVGWGADEGSVRSIDRRAAKVISETFSEER